MRQILNLLKKHPLYAVFIISLVLSFVLYGNTINGEFVFDDYFFAERQELREASYLPKIWLESYIPHNLTAVSYRPLSVFTIALSFILFGKETYHFHLVNIVLNGLFGFVVFFFIYRSFKNVKLAWFSFLVFSFLPIHSEAVAFIKSRDEILSAILSMLAVIFFLKAGEERKKRWLLLMVLSGGLFLLAVLAKELMIVLPLLMVGLYWVFFKPKITKLILSGMVLIPFVFFYLLMRYLALGKYAFNATEVVFAINPLVTADTATRVGTAFKLLGMYVIKIFFPFHLSATYAYNQVELISNPFVSWEGVLGVAILLGLLMLIILRKTRATPLGVGALVFLVPYSIISKFISISGDFFAERWMYLPSVGISMMVGWVLYKLYERKKVVAIILLAVVIAVYGYRLIDRNRVWVSRQALNQSMIKDAPKSIVGYANMATFYRSQSQYTQARESIEKGISIYDKHAPLHIIAGNIALEEGRFSDAENSYKRSIMLDPYLGAGYFELAKLYFLSKDYQKAHLIFEKIIELSQGNPRTEDIAYSALALSKLGKYKEAYQKVKPYLYLRTQRSLIRFTAAEALYKQGKIEESKQFWDWDDTLSEEEKKKRLEGF